MRIQPNYLAASERQPVFKASLAKDTKTTKTLGYAMSIIGRGDDTPEYIYCLSENLKRIKSNDQISIESKDHDWCYWIHDYYISNTRTGATISICHNERNEDSPWELSCRGRAIELEADNLAQALHEGILYDRSLDYLFGRKGAKKKSEFIAPQKGILDAHIEGSGDLSEQIDRNNEAINALEEINNQLIDKFNDLRLNFVKKELNLTE